MDLDTPYILYYVLRGQHLLIHLQSQYNCSDKALKFLNRFPS